MPTTPAIAATRCDQVRVPLDAMFVQGAIAHGPTEVQKVQVVKALLKRGTVAPGVFSSEHIPTRMGALT